MNLLRTDEKLYLYTCKNYSINVKKKKKIADEIKCNIIRNCANSLAYLSII